jgi:hypothetical protein
MSIQRSSFTFYNKTIIVKKLNVYVKYFFCDIIKKKKSKNKANTSFVTGGFVSSGGFETGT